MGRGSWLAVRGPLVAPTNVLRPNGIGIHREPIPEASFSSASLTKHRQLVGREREHGDLTHGRARLDTNAIHSARPINFTVTTYLCFHSPTKKSYASCLGIAQRERERIRSAVEVGSISTRSVSFGATQRMMRGRLDGSILSNIRLRRAGDRWFQADINAAERAEGLKRGEMGTFSADSSMIG